MWCEKRSCSKCFGIALLLVNYLTFKEKGHSESIALKCINVLDGGLH